MAARASSSGAVLRSVADLPSSLLVPFSTQRISNASLILGNIGIVRNVDELLPQYAWLVNSNCEVGKDLLAESKTFLAERYGGAGIGTHGGGVRCGLEGDYQSKGIGCNSLIGDNSPPDYSHGGISLFEAIKEAIWGEVFHYALPYSAARVPAVIATGTRCWWVVERWGEEALRERYGEDIYIPRGLIIRQAAIRPAHFERAVLFSRPTALAKELCPDPQRVRDSMKILHRALPLAEQHLHHASEMSQAERLRYGMAEMAHRFAMQEAAARTKKLIHGNMSSSNICLDGRWIDFGSVTALPGWGDVLGYGSFWDSPPAYEAIFSNLCFNIRKYCPVKNEALPQEDVLLDEFKATQNYWQKKRFLGLTGWPFLFLDRIEKSFAAERMYRVLLSIAKAGHSVPFVFGQPNDGSEFGKYRLCLILFTVVRWFSSPSCEEKIGPLLDDPTLRRELLASYSVLAEEIALIAERFNVSPAALRRLALINSAKSAKTIPLLYVEHLVRACEKMVLAHREMKELRLVIEEFVENLVDEARIVYADPSDLTSTLWTHRGQCLTYKALSDKFYLISDSGCTVQGNCEVDIKSCIWSIVAKARAFFGDEMWESFQ